jgi:hypothetical protein
MCEEGVSKFRDTPVVGGGGGLGSCGGGGGGGHSPALRSGRDQVGVTG